jgi:hypothetical protein
MRRNLIWTAVVALAVFAAAPVHAQNTTVTDVKFGQLLTQEGDFGRSFRIGAANIGIAYCAQWKVTSDDMSGVATGAHLIGIPNHRRAFAVGPDVSIPIAPKSMLMSSLNVRYMWETGAEVKTQGQSLLVTSTIPFNGIRIPGL